MNVFSVTQYTKPKFKDIQDKEKVAWITGISLSIILNIILAILCGVWNDERLTLRTDKTALQGRINQCQNELSYCEFNNSQKTCNNTIYEAGDKKISFNYTGEVTPSNSSNITDTIEIKDNGDIYINGQPAGSNECGYYKIGDETFYIDGLQTAPQEDTSNKIYLDQTQLKIELETDTIQKQQIYPIDENVLGDILYVTNNKYTTIGPGDYSLSVADDKIVRDDIQIWPFKDNIYTTINGNNYSISTPSNELFQWDKLDNSTQIKILENGTITINGKETTTEQCEDLPQEIYLVNEDKYYKYDISNFEKDKPSGELINDITNNFVDGQLIIKNGTQQLTPIGSIIYLPFKKAGENKYYEIVANGSDSFTNTLPEGVQEGKLDIGYIDNLQINLDTKQIYPLQEIYTNFNNEIIQIKPSNGILYNGDYSKVLQINNEIIYFNDEQIYPVQNINTLYLTTDDQNEYKISLPDNIYQTPKQTTQQGVLEITDQELNNQLVLNYEINQQSEQIFPLMNSINILTNGYYSVFDQNKLANLVLYQNGEIIKRNNQQIYPIDENVLGDTIYVTNNKYTTIAPGDYSLSVADDKITKDDIQIWPLGNTIYFEANDTWYSVKGPQQVLSYNPVSDGNLNGALEIGGATNPALTIKGIWGEENSATSTIYINSVAAEEKIEQTTLLGTGCKVNYLGVCLSPANGTSIMNFYNVTYKLNEAGEETDEIDSKKIYMISLPNDKHIKPTNDTTTPEAENYGGTINIEPGVKITLSGTYGNNKLAPSGGVIQLDQINIITSNEDNTNAIYYKPTTIKAECNIYNYDLQTCINPLPQTIYSQDENGENIYQITLPNNIVYKPSGNVQGTVSLNKDYQLSISGKFGQENISQAIQIQTSELKSSWCNLEVDGSCLLYSDNSLALSTVYSSFSNKYYKINLPSKLYRNSQSQTLTGELNIDYNGQITLQSGEFGSETLSPTLTIQDGVKLLTSKCQIMNGTKCLMYLGDEHNTRYYKYTYNDSNNVKQTEYIKFQFDQDIQQKPSINETLTIMTSNGAFIIQSNNHTYGSGDDMFSFYGDYKFENYLNAFINTYGTITGKYARININTDIITDSPYGLYVGNLQSNASKCKVSQTFSSEKNDCWYLWNNTFQIQDTNENTYQIQVNENQYYKRLYPDEYIYEINDIKGNITVLAPISNNNDAYTLIQLNGTYDQSAYYNMINTIQINNTNIKQYNNTNGAFVNITSENNIEADYGIYIYENNTITGIQNTIYVGGNSLISDNIPIQLNNAKITSTNGLVGVQVPQLASIIGDKLICEISTIQTPSSKQDCLNIPSNKLTYKYIQ